MALTKIPSELSSTTGIVDNSNATAITIDSNENVGIGTSSPSSDISSSSTVLEIADSNVASLALNNTTQSTKFEIASLDVSGGALSIRDNNTERLRIDSSGNLGIGTSSPISKLHVTSASTGNIASFFEASTGNTNRLYIGADSGLSYIDATAGAGSTALGFKVASTERMRIDSSGNVQVKGGNELRVYRGDNATYGSIKYLTGSGGLQLNDTNGDGISFVQANGATEYARIDSSGNLLVGTTSGSSLSNTGFRYINSGTSSYAEFVRTTTSDASANVYISRGNDGRALLFYRNDVPSTVGSVTLTTSSTAYNTSSDQRLKENIADADDAGSKIDAIQVRKFDWKVDGSHQDYGMIAQELQTVAPEAVSGDADSEEMMGVDYSKLVPMLIKEIQSLRNRVAQLEE